MGNELATYQKNDESGEDYLGGDSIQPRAIEKSRVIYV